MSTIDPSGSGQPAGLPDPATVARALQTARALVQEAAAVLASVLPADEVSGFGLPSLTVPSIDPLGGVGLSPKVFSRFAPGDGLAAQGDVTNTNGCNGSCPPKVTSRSF